MYIFNYDLEVIFFFCFSKQNKKENLFIYYHEIQGLNWCMLFLLGYLLKNRWNQSHLIPNVFSFYCREPGTAVNILKLCLLMKR